MDLFRASLNSKEEFMSSLPLFYKKIVPLNKEQHKALYVEPVDGYAFAAETNSLYIAAIEFIKSLADYVIVFGKDAEDNVYPVVLLGLKANQNLYVDKKGQWNAGYIPAYARRYPFILAAPEGNQGNFTVCIDEGFSGFNTAKEGQVLFDKKGKESAILKQAVDFLQDYQKNVQITTAFCNNLKTLDLLEPMQANVEMKTGDKFAIGGFLCISRAKLKALKPEKLTELVKSDQMELIFAHLLSLNNVNKLMQKVTAG
jgi:hypothetical protein